jgi:hypothetical protein
VTFFLVLFAIAFAAVSAWLLWRALTRGEVVGHFAGVVRRADAPFSFWLVVAVNIMALTVFGTAGVILAWRALVPPPVAQRATMLYPSRAVAQNASGLVILHCTVTPAFGVKDCTVASETPTGMGFAASALQISALEILPQKDRARAAPGQVINLPIRFKMPVKQP